MTSETHSRDSAGDVVPELHRCPICGRKPIILNYYGSYAVRHDCLDIVGITRTNAAAMWNYRVGPSREDVERLVAAARLAINDYDFLVSAFPDNGYVQTREALRSALAPFTPADNTKESR